MSIWSNIAKMASKVGASSITKEATKSVANVVSHPIQTTKLAVKTAIGGEAAYLGWQAIDKVNGNKDENNTDALAPQKEDKSLVRAASELVIGEHATDSISDRMFGGRDSEQSSVQSLLGAATAQGSRSLGGLFSGLSSGGGGLLEIAGLVAASMLIFGRHGMIGKIAGLVLGLSLISGMIQNDGRQSQMGTALTNTEGQREETEGRSEGMHR